MSKNEERKEEKKRKENKCKKYAYLKSQNLCLKRHIFSTLKRFINLTILSGSSNDTDLVLVLIPSIHHRIGFRRLRSCCHQCSKPQEWQ